MAPSVSFGKRPTPAASKSDSDLLDAIVRIRAAESQYYEDELTSSTLLDLLREDGFDNLTLTQVKAAEKRLESNRAMTSYAGGFISSPSDDDVHEADEDEDIPGFKRYQEPETHASRCNVRGNGLEEATVRQASYFWIEACDAKGRKRTSGGDTFFVAIRGPSQTRARVTDNGDGTYLVVWKPHVSGTYCIAVSLFGVLLPGAPFTVQTTTSNPCASKCSVRGEALCLAVSRAPQNFEILFKDRLGQVINESAFVTLCNCDARTNIARHARMCAQVARAVDLDIFVEPIPLESPRGRGEKPAKPGDEPVESGAETGSFREKRDKSKKEKVDKKPDRKDKFGPGRAGSKSPAATPLMAAASRAHADEDGGPVTHDELVDVEFESKTDEKTRTRTLRVKVKDRPLIVRAGYEKDTEQVGVLLPGQIVTVVEERLPESGEVRACVALDSVARAIDGVTPQGGSAGDFASTFHRAVGDLSPKLITAELSPGGGGFGSSGTSGGAGDGQGTEVGCSAAATSAAPSPARASAAGAPTPDGVSFALDEDRISAPESDPLQALTPQVGWVTLVKSGKKLVSSRVKLGPGSRRQYLGQWARRKLNDKAESMSGHLAKTIMNELKSDPTGVGFGFGGIEPGVLHAQGKLHEVHKVSYSIGLAGHYLLHVRLRQQAMAVPGSPFNLHVLPGAAHAKSTKISSLPLRGMVGGTEDTGCVMTMHAADRMGNLCSAGGAKVQVMCEYPDMVTNVEDNQDGTYRLKWNSKFSGTFRTRVVIDGLDTIGSPREFTLTSSNPCLAKSELSAVSDGLKSAVAGKPSTIRIAFVDDYGNTAVPGPDFKFGMSLNKEKEKLQNVKPHHFEGSWESGDTGVFEIEYTAKVAGGCEMHVWCDPNDEGARIAFPGSPFHVNVSAGKASPATSVVGEWNKVQKDEKGDKNGKAGDSKDELHASDTITLRPLIYDEFGNTTQLPENAMKIVQMLPNGTEALLQCNIIKSSYEVRHETSIAGTHFVHINLFDTPIKGSPVTFTVLPDKPDPDKCKLHPPSEEMLVVDQEYQCVIETFDKFGNKCIKGGLTPQVRLQPIRSGPADQITLVPSNHTVSNPAEDQKNGEYAVKFSMTMACVFKVMINIDKNIQSGGGELPPIQLHIHADPATDTKDVSSGATSAPARRKSVGGNKLLQQAAAEVKQGFGEKEERREKSSLIVAAEAFADGAKSFQFDASEGDKGGRRSSLVSTSLEISTSAAAVSDDVVVSPNRDLFDKTPSPGSKSRRPSVGGARRKSVAQADTSSPTSGYAS